MQAAAARTDPGAAGLLRNSAAAAPAYWASPPPGSLSAALAASQDEVTFAACLMVFRNFVANALWFPHPKREWNRGLLNTLAYRPVTGVLL